MPVQPSLPSTPPHPANTVVDFLPAAPGYPPLHAARAAEEGCWWAPVLIEKYKLEFLVQQCLPDHGGFGNYKFEYTADKAGVSMQESEGQGTHILDVVEKPAEQPITTAIRLKYISKLNPAARANCNAHRQAGESGPVETYQALPSGRMLARKDSTEGTTHALDWLAMMPSPCTSSTRRAIAKRTTCVGNTRM